MKKLLLLVVIAFSICNLFAQTILCPTDKKRNNGNGQCTAGKFTFTYPAPPSPLLMINQIYENGILRPDITAPFPPDITGNKAEYCFVGGNLDPAATLNIIFYLDANQNGQLDAGETIKDCLIPGSGPLPVVLANFNAVSKNGKVSLTWETFQEVENDGFEIQRRVGTGKYETVAFVDSKVIGGTGAGTTYSFDDIAPLAKGVTYYRLRQVDLNGQAAFSEVKALRGLGSPIAVSVYPNPSRGATNVAIPAGSGIMDISLNDFAGKSVQTWNGINISNLQLSNLKPGIYMLRISFRETGEQLTERIVVQ